MSVPTKEQVEDIKSKKKHSPFNDGSFPKLPVGEYSIVYADPPWDYKGQHQHGKNKHSGGADFHYPTVKMAHLINLPISNILAKDCLLFMWSSSPHLDQAIELGKSWGFKWATVGFVWYKEKPNPGFYTMSECEICLIFKRGKIPTPRGARNIKQFLARKREKHSQKPNEIRDRIFSMFPEQPKIELFARQKTKGWSSWGLDIKARSKEV